MQLDKLEAKCLAERQMELNPQPSDTPPTDSRFPPFSLILVYNAHRRSISCILSGMVLPFVSPYTKYTAMMNSIVPYTYPVPVRDDGNMPDVPSHPCEAKGRSLEWFKNM
uniref:NADH dehydrogenase [ubiquinone] 1 alpha subcomplex subunit 3 n=1 Tax=Fundulus heteroclitus TaxID=8078 RepID=A0A3Q2Q4L4_FUNHE